MICGWCITGHCCHGRVAGCVHARRCKVDQATVKKMTDAATEKAMAHARRMRLETQMTGRIRKAWAQLDVATDECIRLNGEIRKLTAAGEPADVVRSFETDLALEQAKAMGKCEILAIIMPAPLDTPKAISQEAGKRYQMRLRGVAYETPGIRMVAASVMDDLEPNEAWT